jgi:hypothetical protein
MLTTRNRDLDILAEGHCLGAQPLNRDIKDVRLRFGVVTIGAGKTPAAFGLEGTVEKLEKGAECF